MAEIVVASPAPLSYLDPYFGLADLSCLAGLSYPFGRLPYPSSGPYFSVFLGLVFIGYMLGVVAAGCTQRAHCKKVMWIETIDYE